MKRIVYLSWPPSEITGGIKLIFQHVELLADAGLDVVVAAEGSGQSSWFKSSARVVDLGEIQKEDILVFPENHAGLLHEFASAANPKVIYCQNPFMIYRGLNGKTDYREFGVSGILALGRFTTDFCRNRFVKLPILNVPAVVSPNVFHFHPEKRLQIAFAPRKRPMEVEFIHDLFVANYPAWRSVPWIQIDQLPELDVARVLKQSAVYLSLQRFEAVGLSALEAMACGCTVAGFTGVGGREYANDANGFWAAEDDLLDCTRQLSRAVESVQSGSSHSQDILEQANRAANFYSIERLTNRIVPFWKAFAQEGEWPS